MTETIQEKIRPVFTLVVDCRPDDWKKQLEGSKEPFVFLKRNDRIYAFVYLKDLEANSWESPNLSLDVILSKAVPLENVGVLNPDKIHSMPFLFRVLGQPIVLVKDQDGEYKGYIRREDVLVGLFREESPNLNLLKILLASIPMGIFVVDHDRKVINCNDSGLKMIRSTSEQVMDVDAGSIFESCHIDKVFATGETVLNQIQITEEMGVLVDYSPIDNRDGNVEGIVIIVQDLPMVEEMAMEIEFVKDLNRDLNAILSTVYDEILVVNSKGELIRHSENYISEFWDNEMEDLVGKNLLDLEEQGLFSPSVTRLVIEQKKKVSIVQDTMAGQKILAIGNPVFDEDGDLQRIVIALRDITESTKLKSELRQTKVISQKYKQELDHLKKQPDPGKTIIYCSQKMENMMRHIKKLAGFSSTVLIQGESGVGKELIAKTIHRQGNRSDKPFLTINCGAIPENLLESELFGYVKGAFTGADSRGKVGYFQQADGGILFLDEIGEISVSLQVKLLRVLQENEVVPVGSAKPIPIDVQIIAATNRDLEKMVEKGEFREDLFYRINVIPVQVPPLRERPEDVPLLAFHFLQQLNQRYQKNYYFLPDVLNLLEVYSWPGNIRELQNLIERIFVVVDDGEITAEFVGQFLKFNKSGKTKPVIPGIMPLHKAQEYVEEQLITLAMKKYKTTTKAAQALGVSQSAVSRKYQKILRKKAIVPLDTGE